ncbi:MAG: hypothetical protein KDD53_11115, partial [Bdellovibrionales bacterium]|nr:hypothetical protein [Bdellovibrionales bacterium]
MSSELSSPNRLRDQIAVVVAMLCIGYLAYVLRTYEIGLRPLHNDEGVNFYFLQEIGRLGYYPYSHENYHGPLYFYFT